MSGYIDSVCIALVSGLWSLPYLGARVEHEQHEALQHLHKVPLRGAVLRLSERRGERVRGGGERGGRGVYGWACGVCEGEWGGWVREGGGERELRGG